MYLLKLKIKDIILLVLVVVFAYFMVSNGLALKRLRKQQTKSLVNAQLKNDNIIKVKKNEIQLILKDNAKKQVQIIKYKQSIDSLIALKTKISVKYINVYKDVNSYSGEKVLNYWSGYFNKQ